MPKPIGDRSAQHAPSLHLGIHGASLIEAQSIRLRDMPSILTHFYRHNRWANQHMFEACRDLSESQLDTAVQGTYGSLRDTLVHLLRAEVGYVHRLTGKPRLFGREDPFPGIDPSLEILDQTGAMLEEISETLDPHRKIEVGPPDDPQLVPGFVVLLQAVNHATEHRSQIATILTQIGRQPPELDMWAYDEAGLSRT